LYLAILLDDKEAAQLLIEKGAELQTRDKNGVTPLQWAIKKSRPELTGLLREHGAVE